MTGRELRVVRLRANAGHQAALSAGLARARGDYVVSLDADLQDPPEVIAEMLVTARREGVDVVYGVRSDRSTDSTFKRWTGPRLLPTHAGPLAHRGARRRRGLPAHVPRHRRRGLRPARSSTGSSGSSCPALGFPLRGGGLPPRGPRRRQDEVPPEPDDPPVRRQRHRVLDRPAAARDLARPRRWLRGPGHPRLRRRSPASTAMSSPAGPRPSSSSSAVGAVQLLSLGILGEYVGRMYTPLQGRPAYFVAHDSLDQGSHRTSLPAGDGRDGTGQPPDLTVPLDDPLRRRQLGQRHRARGRAASGSRCRSRHRTRTRRRR